MKLYSSANLYETCVANQTRNIESEPAVESKQSVKSIHNMFKETQALQSTPARLYASEKNLCIAT